MENLSATNVPQNPEGKPEQIPPVTKLTSRPKTPKFIPILAILIIILAGSFSGLVLASRTKSEQNANGAKQLSEEQLQSEVPESFAQTFRDEAQGTIQKNDALDKYAQGTHKLIREGGESQTAYLTSSVLDLSEYEGKEVKVYGETFGSSQVGWLMDVGKVEEL